MKRYMTRQLLRKRREDEGECEYSYSLAMVREGCTGSWSFTEAVSPDHAAKMCAEKCLGGLNGHQSNYTRFIEVATNLEATETQVFRVKSEATVTVEAVG